MIEGGQENSELSSGQPPLDKKGEASAASEPQRERGGQHVEPAQRGSLSEERHQYESPYLARADKYRGIAVRLETLPDEFSDAELHTHMSGSPLYDSWGNDQETKKTGLWVKGKTIKSQLALSNALQGGAKRDEVAGIFREAAQRDAEDGKRVGDWAEALYLHRPGDCTGARPR